MPRTAETDSLCQQCWDLALYAFGTASAFQKRSQKYKRWLRWLSFAGIVFPLMIGGLVLSFGANLPHLRVYVAVALLAGLAQLVVSAWSYVSGWAEELDYSAESAADNFGLSARFRELGRQAQNPPADIQIRFAEVKAQDNCRRASDYKRGLTAKELRFGHRAGLRQFNRECLGCHTVPTSMDPSDCPICGGF
jgi:mobilome CxxCx(11)CxxC protein